MPYDPQKHHRHSIRLKGYDYSQAGLYFITICVQHRLCLLGDITVGAIPCGCPNEINGTGFIGSIDFIDRGRPQGSPLRLNDAGKMVEHEWLNLPDRFPNIQLHEFVVMPNHFHAILQICEKGNITVGNIVGAFQSIVTVEYTHGVKQQDWQPFPGKLWQRDYWEHIIRNQREYDNIANYILNNPFLWDKDVLKG